MILGKIMSGGLAFLAIACAGLWIRLYIVSKDLALANLKSASLEASLASQNASLEKLRLDSIKYKEEAALNEKAFTRKYEVLLADNERLKKTKLKPPVTNAKGKCEEELNNYKQAIAVSLDMLNKRLK